LHLLIKAQLNWAGHAVRMNDERLPKRLLYAKRDLLVSNAGITRTCWKSQFAADPNDWNTTEPLNTVNGVTKLQWVQPTTKITEQSVFRSALLEDNELITVVPNLAHKFLPHHL